MSITILPALPTDAATITPIGVLAFANDVFNARLAKPNGTPAQHEEYLQWRIRRNERRMAKPGGTWFKAVDAETGEVVGCTGLQAPGPEEGEGEANGEVQEAEPEIFNGEFMREWHEAMEKVRKECMGERQDYWCESFGFLLGSCSVFFVLMMLDLSGPRCGTPTDRSRRRCIYGRASEPSRQRNRKAAAGKGLRAR